MELGGRLTTPEQLARHNIDRMLELAGWSVQDMKSLDFTASRGVALREFPLEAGFADYMLFVDRQAVGVVEAKKEGTTLSGVDTQSKKYLDGLPAHVQRVGTPLPFAYESTGVETVFSDVRDPDYRSRRVFSFHRPGTLLGWAREAGDAAGAPEGDAASGNGRPARVPGRGDRGARALARREQAALADPDGHRERQDVHGR